MRIDPVTLPWTWERQANSEDWGVVRTCVGDFVARVKIEYAQLVAALPELLIAAENAGALDLILGAVKEKT